MAEDGRLLDTTISVVAGITYNYLPFMILPLYASLERIDKRMLEAGYDLYGRRRDVFLRVTLPLSMPGVVAGTLLTFIPASGDFINAELLGTPNQFMIGNVIQSPLSRDCGLPDSSCALVPVDGVSCWSSSLIWARIAGTEALLGTEGERTVTLPPPWSSTGFLNAFAGLALVYLLIPIAVILVFSFNDPQGRFNFIWQEFSFDAWLHPFAVPGVGDALEKSLQIAALSTIGATILGTLTALALVATSQEAARPSTSSSSSRWPRPRSSSVPRCSRSSSTSARRSSASPTILIAHIMFNLSFVVITVRSRLIGFDRSLEEAAQDLGATPFETFRLVTLPLIMPGVVVGRAARLCAVDRRLCDHELQLRIHPSRSRSSSGAPRAWRSRRRST